MPLRSIALVLLLSLSTVAQTIHYRAIRVSSSNPAKELLDSLRDERAVRWLLELNRKDLRHIRRGDSLIVADPMPTDSNTLSPLPLLIPAIAQYPQYILVSLRVQAVGAYEAGRLIKWAAVNTGRRDMPTPDGHFHLNWKSPWRRSTIDSTWILKWYFNIDSYEGVSMHEFEMPGYAASHSCIRMLGRDARWFYKWGHEWVLENGKVKQDGTPVLIFGHYAYGKRPPWKRLLLPASDAFVPMSEIEEALKMK